MILQVRVEDGNKWYEVEDSYHDGKFPGKIWEAELVTFAEHLKQLGMMIGLAASVIKEREKDLPISAPQFHCFVDNTDYAIKRMLRELERMEGESEHQNHGLV